MNTLADHLRESTAILRLLEDVQEGRITKLEFLMAVHHFYTEDRCHADEACLRPAAAYCEGCGDAACAKHLGRGNFGKVLLCARCEDAMERDMELYFPHERNGDRGWTG